MNAILFGAMEGSYFNKLLLLL